MNRTEASEFSKPYDVAAIGGGPGGAALAAFLARQGRRCVVFEQGAFPRYHIGESLVPHSRCNPNTRKRTPSEPVLMPLQRSAERLMSLTAKRVYDTPAPQDGKRVLVDRLWPRGLKRDTARVDDWLKTVAPSDDLRRWFHHEPRRWAEFCRRYEAELGSQPETWRPLLEAARREPVTLLFVARDLTHNNAVALKAFLESHLEAGTRHDRSPDWTG